MRLSPKINLLQPIRLAKAQIINDVVRARFFIGTGIANDIGRRAGQNVAANIVRRRKRAARRFDPGRIFAGFSD
jgi:hypothetical protein